MLFPGGYAQILDGLTSGLDIRTGTPAGAVEYRDGAKVVAGEKSISAERVLVTVPLGVLRDRAISFDPPLPPAKRDAIARLQMGLLDKLYLRFPDVFWDGEADIIGFMPDERGEWVTWLNMAKHSGEPILAAFNSGSVARRFESRSDEELVAAALAVLGTIYA